MTRYSAVKRHDGGITWTLVKGLSGFRSAVAFLPGPKTPTFVAVGPSGADYSTDDGRTWTPIDGRGFDTLSFAHSTVNGFAAGARGSLGRLTFSINARSEEGRHN